MLTEKPLTFGAYQILNLVGKGGMAKVYRCVDTRDGKIVAVKMLKQPKNADAALLRSFEREIQAMSQVSHPYIVPLLDYSLTSALSYLVVPYFEGGSVADRLAMETYSPREAAQLLTHLAFALDYAHSRGYIHRDLKPSNLLLDAQGQTYLSDFGLASAIGSAGQAFGTAAYMAPELAAGASADVRTDVYALGVTLYELLTGHRPFEADGFMTYEHLHRRAVPPTMSQLNSAVPPELDALAMKALDKSPAGRYQSAGEMARQFNGAVEALPESRKNRRASLGQRPHIVLAPVRTATGRLSLASDAPTNPARPVSDKLRTTSTLSRIPPVPKEALQSQSDQSSQIDTTTRALLIALIVALLILGIVVLLMVFLR